MQEDKPQTPAPISPAPVPTPPMTPAPLQPTSNIATTVLIIVVLILLGTTGYFAYQNYLLQQKITSLQNQTMNVLLSPSPTTDPTINWKTYVNTQRGFILKFPEIFIYPKLVEPTDSAHFSTRSNVDGPRELVDKDLFLEITVYPNLDENALKKVRSAISAKPGDTVDQPFQPIGKITKTKDFNSPSDGNGSSFYESIPDPNEATYYIGMWEKDQNVYVIKMFGQINSLTVYGVTFNQILSTFKFTESSYICPAGGGENCMPILNEDRAKECTPEAIAWKKKNCPGYRVSY
mgnify:CR=1 FL=1